MSTEYPDTMSCKEAFDQMTICLSLGGQFRNYYRYGKFNQCEVQLEKFKFCLFNGKDPVKVQEWYRKQMEYNKEHRGSSDDIWEER
ncbi:hypothetical protein Kpol_2000p97 [Vanderwaltozyma polyspora DSM 70294]|uniref:Early meiotic induction protein 1 n=1 Tax=Vanderwaltozyma polyspora (strain ATCC 22028 / DSM 70294 / BCRC 21397 / CBS 2163 / NBRC 10782 / NRRL Y-8283 / UCD 57-17) TaxID=436907 RepID=A7TFA4_VANPO|nr:uncharacterized protein Kpol_2000p97 [Vanderwaltozyma polyspora DSM 70294]EDO19129.1 hypothetical protein Kpol_2000p97 [Vanderwaltozyma polyspora DSM 70294]